MVTPDQASSEHPHRIKVYFIKRQYLTHMTEKWKYFENKFQNDEI